MDLKSNGAESQINAFEVRETLALSALIKLLKRQTALFQNELISDLPVPRLNTLAAR